MKVNYDIILEEYERINQDFLEECTEIALEADNSTENQINNPDTLDTTSQDTSLDSSSKRKQGIIKKIQNVIKYIVNLVQRTSIKILNRIKLLLESDKGFMNAYHQRRGTIKPLRNFKAITYNYNNDYLDKTMRGIQSLAIESIKWLTNFTALPSKEQIKAIINCDTKNVESVFLSNFTTDKNNNTPSVNSFTREMIDLYRREKRETMHNQSEIPMLTNIAKSTNELTNTCNGMTQQLKASVNSIKQLEGKARAQKNAEALNEITKRSDKAMKIYNMYITIVNMYFELKLEHSLSAKALLKKFYQF